MMQAEFISAVQQGLKDEQAGRMIGDDELDVILAQAKFNYTEWQKNFFKMKQ